jgi:hypothetical protein
MTMQTHKLVWLGWHYVFINAITKEEAIQKAKDTIPDYVKNSLCGQRLEYHGVMKRTIFSLPTV